MKCVRSNVELVNISIQKLFSISAFISSNSCVHKKNSDHDIAKRLRFSLVVVGFLFLIHPCELF